MSEIKAYESVIILRQIELGLCSISVAMGKLLMVSDYGISGQLWDALNKLDGDVGSFQDRISAIVMLRKSEIDAARFPDATAASQAAAPQ